jgi:hypothetical protein
VAPYIQIEGLGWYTKPTFASPTVPINADGTFTANVTTGGIDGLATIYVAALILATVNPPLAAGAGRIPASLAPIAIDSVVRYSRTFQFAAGFLRGFGYDGDVALRVDLSGSAAIQAVEGLKSHRRRPGSALHTTAPQIQGRNGVEVRAQTLPVPTWPRRSALATRGLRRGTAAGHQVNSQLTLSRRLRRGIHGGALAAAGRASPFRYPVHS